MVDFLTFCIYIMDEKTKSSELSNSKLSPRFNVLLIYVNAV